MVAEDLVDGLLAIPFDGSIASERALSSFTNRWISHLQTSVVPAPADEARTGLVTLDRLAWHEVEVLKFVHRHFILDRADIVMYQRGLSRVLDPRGEGPHGLGRPTRSTATACPSGSRSSSRSPTDGYARVRAARPEGVPIPDAGDVLRLGVGRGVIDYVASLSDDQALAVSEAIDGRPDRLWDIGQNL